MCSNLTCKRAIRNDHEHHNCPIALDSGEDFVSCSQGLIIQMTSNWPLTSTLIQWQAHAPPVNNKQMEKEKGQKHMDLIEILSGGFSVGKRK